MKLTVCFKTIFDYGMVPAEEWQIIRRHPVDPGFVRQVFNCYEESALEMALALGKPGRASGQIAEKWALKNPDRSLSRTFKMERTALTVDDSRADLFLRHLYAVGYDQAIRVAPDTNLDFSPWAVAKIIAAWAARKESPDLMIFSSRGGAGEHCQTGPLVAEMLGWPCLMSVAALDLDETENLQVTCRTERACRIHAVKPPLVLVTGIAADTLCLRIPTLKQKLAARKRMVQVVCPADLGLPPSDLEGMGHLPDLAGMPKSHRACTLIHGDSPWEKAQKLATRYLKPKRVP